MIPNHSQEDVILISDDSLITALASDDHEILEAAQTIINYLSFKEQNKSVVMIPKIYSQILSRAKELSTSQESNELVKYIESFCCEAKIGYSEKNPNSQEYKTVIDYLFYSHKSLIFFITDDESCKEMVKSFHHSGLLCGTVQEVKRFILSNDGEFYQQIFATHYDSSTV